MRFDFCSEFMVMVFLREGERKIEEDSGQTNFLFLSLSMLLFPSFPKSLIFASWSRE